MMSLSDRKIVSIRLVNGDGTTTDMTITDSFDEASFYRE